MRLLSVENPAVSLLARGLFLEATSREKPSLRQGWSITMASVVGQPRKKEQRIKMLEKK